MDTYTIWVSNTLYYPHGYTHSIRISFLHSPRVEADAELNSGMDERDSAVTGTCHLLQVIVGQSPQPGLEHVVP